MKKIYLSTSYAGKDSNILQLESFLNKFNCEIIKFNGSGKFTENDKVNLLKCDNLLILPPKKTSPCDLRIGKGQFSEIELFIKEKSINSVFIISNILDDNFYCSAIERIFILNIDWQKDYANVELNINKQFNNSIVVNLDLSPKKVELKLTESKKTEEATLENIKFKTSQNV